MLEPGDGDVQVDGESETLYEMPRALHGAFSCVQFLRGVVGSAFDLGVDKTD